MAIAQPASSITPHSFAPPPEAARGSGFTIAPDAGLVAPAGADQLFVTLAAIRVDGGLPALARAAEALRTAIAGKRVSAAVVFAAARDLEAAYARAGYVLARVVLPPQTLADGGTARISVIDGVIARIETKSVPDRVRKRITSLVGPLSGKPWVTLAELQRRILLAGDTPGVLLNSTLAPGEASGTTILVIEAKYQPVTATFSADNTLSTSIGHYQAGISTELDSVLGHGERIYLGATGLPSVGPDGIDTPTARNRILAGGFVVPLGTDGLTLNIEATQAITTPRAVNAVQATDEFERLSIRLRYPWVRARDFDLASALVFDAQDERNTLLRPTNEALSLDRLRILRISNDGDYLTASGGAFSGTLTASFGLDALGARSAAEATTALPLSRQGANDTFVKLDLMLTWQQSLAEHLSTTWTLHAQTAFGSALEHAEQIGITGDDALSAYYVGALQGDSGAVLRGELATPFHWRIAWRQTGVLALPYIFGAAGQVDLAKPTSLETGQALAGAFGLGLRVGTGRQGSLASNQLRLEFGHQTGGDGIHPDNRLTFATTLMF